MEAVRQDLGGYPDRALLYYLETGFRTGALDQRDGPAAAFTLWPNHKSARDPGVGAQVRAAVEAEVARGWVDHLGVAHDSNSNSLAQLLTPLEFDRGLVAPLSTTPKGASIRVIQFLRVGRYREHLRAPTLASP
jgi:hypothetical protein